MTDLLRKKRCEKCRRALLNDGFCYVCDHYGPPKKEDGPKTDADKRRWGPLRGECFDLLGFALLYMDYLHSDWPQDQHDQVVALCREVAANKQEPSLKYWELMRERIHNETENMC